MIGAVTLPTATDAAALEVSVRIGLATPRP